MYQEPKTKALARKALKYLKDFLNIEANGGVILLVITALTLIIANSSLFTFYNEIWHSSFTVKILNLEFSYSLHFIINEILMTLFFLVVGIEIRQEIYNGSLSDLKQASLPVIAAIGGVVAPALIFLSLNTESLLRQGWAVPTATDIAFAVGILSLIKKHIPSNLRVFLLTLAIIDDIIAVLIIAIFYSNGINYHGFLFVAFGIGIMLLLRALRANYLYMIPMIIIWGGLFVASIHPTLAGIIIGLLMPVGYKNTNSPETQSLPVGEKVQKLLHPWVTYLIIPLFAFANAGINISNINFEANGSILLITTIIVALVVGKPFGIFISSFIAVRLGFCKLPANIRWQHILLVGLLAGIGFTMSIFIALLGFANALDLLESCKFAILVGSLIASVLGLSWGLFCSRKANIEN